MSLVTKINTIVTSLSPDATFLLSSKFKANRASFDIASASFPLVILDNELSKDAQIMKNNNILKDTRIIITFLSLDKLDNTDVQTNTLIETLESLADSVAANIYQLPEVMPIGNQKYKLTPAFHVFATNLSGVILEMKANENVIANFCET